MLVAEFSIDTPILAEALAAADGTRLSLEAEDVTDPVRLLVWATGDDVDGFEAAMADDPTVADASAVAEAAGRRLYRVHLSADGEAVALYPIAVDLDVTVLTADATERGWEVRALFPDRDVLASFRRQCRGRGVPFALDALYAADGDDPGERFDLTPRQREALVAALDAGYFTVPRRASLSDVADDLDRSSQAVSERLRRGTATLVRSALAPDA